MSNFSLPILKHLVLDVNVMIESPASTPYGYIRWIGAKKNIIKHVCLETIMDSNINYKRNLSKAEKEDIKGMERKLKRDLEIIYGEGKGNAKDKKGKKRKNKEREKINILG